MSKIRKADAMKVLEAVRAQFPKDYEDAFTLKSDFDGHDWVILGEMGPHEWTYTFPEGRSDWDIPDVTAQVPGHLYAEAINHYSIALYRRPEVSPERAADLALRVNERGWDAKDHTDWRNAQDASISEAEKP